MFTRRNKLEWRVYSLKNKSQGKGQCLSSLRTEVLKSILRTKLQSLSTELSFQGGGWEDCWDIVVECGCFDGSCELKHCINETVLTIL